MGLLGEARGMLDPRTERLVRDLFNEVFKAGARDAWSLAFNTVARHYEQAWAAKEDVSTAALRAKEIRMPDAFEEDL